MKSFTARINPSGKTVNFTGETLLIDLIYDTGFVVKSPCGGKGICGKCAVKVSGILSVKTDKEKELLPDDNMRLACQAEASGDVQITLDERTSVRENISEIFDADSFFGAAVDIGTTSVKISLVNFKNQKKYLLSLYLNPQRRFGHDVISRISASSDEKILESMTDLIRNSIENEMYSALKEFKIGPEKFKKFVISANSVMTYLFHGMKVSSLGIFPYETPVKEFPVIKAGVLGFKNIPEAEILTMPLISAYIGGDLVSGAAFTEKLGYSDGIFFADLGTNGEIFLKIKDKIFAASCAMGPALEGMNISCGMTAEQGAITHAEIENDNFIFSSIGDDEPIGISGTGLIDSISILIDKGFIGRNGAFNKNAGSYNGVVFDKENSRIYISKKVFISQKDIRNIQLAKGAVLAASQILLQAAGIKPESVKHTAIAGSFGDNLDIDKFKNLNFIPDFKNSEYIFLGNTSLESAQLACLDEEYYRRASEISRKIEYIELSNHKSFNDIFMESLDF
jgi:uncharacterized 2Fe-2S/4Fe-4S cluster protein (DUF4445 family)